MLSAYTTLSFASARLAILQNKPRNKGGHQQKRTKQGVTLLVRKGLANYYQP